MGLRIPPKGVCGCGTHGYLFNGVCCRCWRKQHISQPSTVKLRAMPVAGSGKPTSRPTSALPGTAAKVAAMEERAMLGECLFHAADAQREAAMAG